MTIIRESIASCSVPDVLAIQKTHIQHETQNAWGMSSLGGKHIHTCAVEKQGKRR
jgi:hypothetical protein